MFRGAVTGNRLSPRGQRRFFCRGSSIMNRTISNSWTNTGLFNTPKIPKWWVVLMNWTGLEASSKCQELAVLQLSAKNYLFQWPNCKILIFLRRYWSIANSKNPSLKTPLWKPPFKNKYESESTYGLRIHTRDIIWQNIEWQGNCSM